MSLDGSCWKPDFSCAKGKAESLDFERVDHGVAESNIYISASKFTSSHRKRYLCYFYHRHLSFRLAEVQAVAEVAYGVDFRGMNAISDEFDWFDLIIRNRF